MARTVLAAASWLAAVLFPALVLAGIVPGSLVFALSEAVLAGGVTALSRRRPDGLHRRTGGAGRDHPRRSGRTARGPGGTARGPAAGCGPGLTAGEYASEAPFTVNALIARNYLQARYGGPAVSGSTSSYGRRAGAGSGMSTVTWAGGGSGSMSSGGGGSSGFASAGGLSSGSVSAGGGGGNGGFFSGLPSSLPSRDGFSQDDGPPLAIGSHTGYRWWSLTAPDFRGSPAGADEQWDPDYRNLLHGARAPWGSGAVTARCLTADRQASTGLEPDHDPAVVPFRDCSCGHWSYWQFQRYPLGNDPGQIPVAGVIKGWGRIRRGPDGFRCEKARILAVTLPFALVPAVSNASTADVLRRHLPASRVHGDGEPLHVPARSQDPHVLVHAEAWMAVIGDRIGQMYPGVRVFESVNALCAVFPPDTSYTQRRFTCPRCGRSSAGTADRAEGYCGSCHDWTGTPPRLSPGG